jgi:hypothetical protein
VKGSTTFFLIPFLPFERRLFLPTATATVSVCPRTPRPVGHPRPP